MIYTAREHNWGTPLSSLYYCYSNRLSFMFCSFLFDFVHHLFSTALLSLSELSSAAKFFKISLVQSSNFPSVGSLWLSLVCTLLLYLIYVDKVLRLKLHI